MPWSVAATLVLIQQNTIRYGFPMLLVFGNVGNLLLVVIFTRRHHRRNSCSLYLLASAIFGTIGLNWALITNANALYQIPDPFTLSLFLCRLRGYILQTTAVLYRSMIILACIDRYAMSSARVHIRAFSKRSLAIKMIVATTLFWLLVTGQQPFFQIIQFNRCFVFGLYGLIFSIYQICLLGWVFPGLMVVFSSLLWKNLRNIRVRIRTYPVPVAAPARLGPPILHKRDISLMKFVFVEIVVAIMLSFSYPVNVLYSVLASNVPNKSIERVQIEGFSTFITQLFLSYLNYCVTFYLYAMMSRSFRAEIKRTVFQCLRKSTQERTTTNPRLGQ